MKATRETIVKKIKTRGYWRIKFSPLKYVATNSFPWCKEVIERNSVRLRGWYYPHFPRRKGGDTGLIPGENFYEGWIDWNRHKERWRMYRRGTFTHYLALREDWIEEDSFLKNESKTIKPNSVLSVTGTVYQLTEIFEFLSRLTKEGIYDEGVEVFIGLFNTRNRQLKVLDPGRVSLLGDYITGAEKIRFSKKLSKKELSGNLTETAFEAIVHFFQRFGWNNPPRDVIKKDQQRFIEGRI